MTSGRRKLSDAEFSTAANALYNEIRSVGRNQWEHVLRALGSPLLVEHVNKAAATNSPPKGGECPGHGGKDGFALMKDWRETGGGNCWTCGPKPSATILLAWDRSWSHWEASLEVADFLGVDTSLFRKTSDLVTAKPFVRPELTDEARREIERRAEAQRSKDVKREAELAGLLDSLKPIDWASRSCPVARYFEYRGLGPIRDDPPSDIYVGPLHRWGGRDKSGAWNDYGLFPNFVSVIRGPDGLVCGAQRVYVTEQGEKPFAALPKSERPDHKMTVPLPSYRTIKGGTVRLYDAERTLGIGEGVETMLGLRLFMAKRKLGRRLAVWSTLTTSGLRSAWIPEHVTSLQQYLDNDPPKVSRDGRVALGAGLAAGLTMRSRMLERGGTKLFIPPSAGKDWLDIFLEYELSMNKLNRNLAPAFELDAPEPFSWGMRDAVLSIVASESGTVLVDPEALPVAGAPADEPHADDSMADDDIDDQPDRVADISHQSQGAVAVPGASDSEYATSSSMGPSSTSRAPMQSGDFDSEMLSFYDEEDEDIGLDYSSEQAFQGGAIESTEGFSADDCTQVVAATEEPGWIIVTPGGLDATGVQRKPHVRLSA